MNRFSLVLTTLFLVGCSAISNGNTEKNQGHIIQDETGNLRVHLNNINFSSNSAINSTSVFIIYVYKQVDRKFGSSYENCINQNYSNLDEQKLKQRCEDREIFLNEAVDAIGFSNEPGFYGLQKSGSDIEYSPALIVEPPVADYPSHPVDAPPGYTDADYWQCYSRYWLNGAYECGINPHPIKYLDLDNSSFIFKIHAADTDGYPGIYRNDYFDFQHFQHPVSDGDRFYAYIGVHYHGLGSSHSSAQRFTSSSSIFTRPVKPDLISERIEIEITLLSLDGSNSAGGLYNIPKFNSWYKPFTLCEPSQANAGDIIISEILWAGSQQSTGTNSHDDEFLELFNTTGTRLILTDWQIKGAGYGGGAIKLPRCLSIAANSTTTIGNTRNKAFPYLTVTYQETLQNISLANTGRHLVLEDASGNTIHEVNCSSGWPAAESSSPRVSMTSSAVTPACADYTATTALQTLDESINADYRFNSSYGTYASPGRHP